MGQMERVQLWAPPSSPKVYGPQIPEASLVGLQVFQQQWIEMSLLTITVSSQKMEII